MPLDRSQLSLQQQLVHANDAVHGSANFVAHVGEEAALGAIGGIGGFAGVDELGLVALLFGDLLGDAGDADQVSLWIANGKGAVANPFLLAVGGEDAVFDFDRLARHLIDHHFFSLLSVLRMDRVSPRHGIPVDAFHRSAPNLFIGGAHIERLAGFDGHDPKYIADILSKLAESLFAGAQSLVRELAVGDFLGNAGDANQHALGIAERERRGRESISPGHPG